MSVPGWTLPLPNLLPGNSNDCLGLCPGRPRCSYTPEKSFLAFNSIWSPPTSVHVFSFTFSFKIIVLNTGWYTLCYTCICCYTFQDTLDLSSTAFLLISDCCIRYSYRLWARMIPHTLIKSLPLEVMVFISNFLHYQISDF